MVSYAHVLHPASKLFLLRNLAVAGYAVSLVAQNADIANATS
jgi:hypothetical protein